MSSLVSKVVAELGIALEWLTAPHPATIHLHAGSHVGDELSKQISGRVQRLREADDTVPGRILYPHVIAERDQVATLLDNANANTRTRTVLLTALAELEQLAGWIAADGNASAQAQTHYLAGIRAANEAGDPVTAAQLWSCLAYMFTGNGDAVDGLFVAEAARRRGELSSPLVACLLAERHAYAAAVASDSYACHMALADADALLAAASPDIPEPAWVYWLDAAEVAVMAGRCMLLLGKPDRAVPLLRDAIASYPADHAREVALYRGWLAAAYAAAGDREAAQAEADAAAIIAGGAGVDSERVADRLDSVFA
ncbi:hypothetical protein [Stackebrandtia nassauensis]|uniref:Uncharacterized protein n=1 Tax=Stackebrandtia nassauensis (strain DSM 44728 / CIP 108903 / NRRL B-16338 / NBRC 102104 / LLR-40K-21) TaxID=446470 RepID=D3Q5J6_STANL|nr:hypothetical protein [Stackebrandtia nassauensis]ADD46056.1 hypothetical protein Snas_6440 [Stackebrandtia nassauensis DSM 44728]